MSNNLSQLVRDDDCEVQPGNSTFEVLSVLVPSTSPVWHPRSDGWFVVFYVVLVMFGVLFLGFALACMFLLIKRHLAQRFKVRTFIAIDLALMTLGISRSLFILLDPWGQSGFCTHQACIIISRLLGSLGFPSLTASYTLVFITLWISARIRLGTSWIQKLKILIPLCFLHYGVAILFEIVAALPFRTPLVVVSLLVACEAIFSLWGFLVCLLFGIAGFRLLRTVKKSAKSSSIICKDSPNVNRHDLIDKAKFQNSGTRARSATNRRLRKIVRGQQKKSIRKVTLITYITVVLGMLYSILSIVNLVLVVLTIFEGCVGTISGRKQHPALWMTLKCLAFILELSMGVLLTYAISDYTPLIKFLKMILTCSLEDCNSSALAKDESLVNSCEPSVSSSMGKNSLPRNLPGFSVAVEDSFSQRTPTNFPCKSPSPLSVSVMANGDAFTPG